MNKILVIEDDNDIADYIRFAFMTGFQDPELIFAYNGMKGIECFNSCKPDLILLDLMLPDIHGFEIVERIRAVSTVPIIVITVEENESSLVQALALGVDEYVVKPFGQMEIVARVKALLRRYNYSKADGKISKIGPWEFDLLNKTLTMNNEIIYLTSTENRILHLLLSNRGHIVTFDHIAQDLWGGVYPGTSDNIRVFISCLRKKLEKSIQHSPIILTKTNVGYYVEK